MLGTTTSQGTIGERAKIVHLSMCKQILPFCMPWYAGYCCVTFPLTFLVFLLQGRDRRFQFNIKVSNRIWVFNNNLVVAVLPSGTPVEIQLFVVHLHVECCINLHETCMSNSSNGRPIHWFHLHVPKVHVARCAHWQHQAPETHDGLEQKSREEKTGGSTRNWPKNSGIYI